MVALENVAPGFSMFIPNQVREIVIASKSSHSYGATHVMLTKEHFECFKEVCTVGLGFMHDKKYQRRLKREKTWKYGRCVLNWHQKWNLHNELPHIFGSCAMNGREWLCLWGSSF